MGQRKFHYEHLPKKWRFFVLVAFTGCKVFIICEIQTFQLFQIRDIPIIDLQTHNRTDTWLPNSFYNWIKYTHTPTHTHSDQNRRHSKTQMLHKPNLITKFFVRFRFVCYRFSFSFVWKQKNIHIHYTQTRIAETLSGNDWVSSLPDPFSFLSLHSFVRRFWSIQFLFHTKSHFGYNIRKTCIWTMYHSSGLLLNRLRNWSHIQSATHMCDSATHTHTDTHIRKSILVCSFRL